MNLLSFTVANKFIRLLRADTSSAPRNDLILCYKNILRKAIPISIIPLSQERLNLTFLAILLPINAPASRNSMPVTSENPIMNI